MCVELYFIIPAYTLTENMRLGLAGIKVWQLCYYGLFYKCDTW